MTRLTMPELGRTIHERCEANEALYIRRAIHDRILHLERLLAMPDSLLSNEFSRSRLEYQLGSLRSLFAAM